MIADEQHRPHLQIVTGEAKLGECIVDDLMAWTITKDAIVQREVVSAERVQPPPTSPEYMKAKRSGEAGYSDFINSGKWEGYTPPPLPER